jgi:hypothetical protein
MAGPLNLAGPRVSSSGFLPARRAGYDGLRGVRSAGHSVAPMRVLIEPCPAGATEAARVRPTDAWPPLAPSHCVHTPSIGALVGLSCLAGVMAVSPFCWKLSGAGCVQGVSRAPSVHPLRCELSRLTLHVTALTLQLPVSKECNRNKVRFSMCSDTSSCKQSRLSE